MNYIIYALLFWNLIVFLLYGMDKRKAMKNKWRVSENTLIICAFFMGGTGAFVGMRAFRHKTKHLKFKILVPLSVVFNVAILALIYYVFEGGGKWDTLITMLKLKIL